MLCLFLSWSWRAGVCSVAKARRRSPSPLVHAGPFKRPRNLVSGSEQEVEEVFNCRHLPAEHTLELVFLEAGRPGKRLCLSCCPFMKIVADIAGVCLEGRGL